MIGVHQLIIEATFQQQTTKLGISLEQYITFADVFKSVRRAFDIGDMQPLSFEYAGNNGAIKVNETAALKENLHLADNGVLKLEVIAHEIDPSNFAADVEKVLGWIEYFEKVPTSINEDAKSSLRSLFYASAVYASVSEMQNCSIALSKDSKSFRDTMSDKLQNDEELETLMPEEPLIQPTEVGYTQLEDEQETEQNPIDLSPRKSLADAVIDVPTKPSKNYVRFDLSKDKSTCSTQTITYQRTIGFQSGHIPKMSNNAVNTYNTLFQCKDVQTEESVDMSEIQSFAQEAIENMINDISSTLSNIHTATPPEEDEGFVVV